MEALTVIREIRENSTVQRLFLATSPDALLYNLFSQVKGEIKVLQFQGFNTANCQNDRARCSSPRKCTEAQACVGD